MLLRKCDQTLRRWVHAPAWRGDGPLMQGGASGHTAGLIDYSIRLD